MAPAAVRWADLFVLGSVLVASCGGGDGPRGPRPGVCGWVGEDRDGDGLPDAIEDADGDGVQDFGECDPSSPDSDRDGIVDSVEMGCDGRWMVGIESRCDVRDTDGDGLEDGVEDANRNGRRDPGETSAGVADTDSDGCSDFAEGTFTDPLVLDTDADALADGTEGNCDPVIQDALCETDPTDPDTDDDGVVDRVIACPFSICSVFPLTRRPVAYALSEEGGWKLALPGGPPPEPTLVEDAVVAGAGGPGDARRAAVADVRVLDAAGVATAGVAAFVASVPHAGTGASDAGEARALVVGRLAAAWPDAAAGDALAVRSRGDLDESWDGLPLARLVRLELDGGAGATRDGAALRRDALAALLGVAPGAVTDGLMGAGVGAVPGAPVVLTLAVTVRDDGRAIVVGALADAAAHDDGASGVRVAADDLAGGAALGEPGDTETEQCNWAWDVTNLEGDLLLVVDPAVVPAGANGAALLARAAAARLDLRVGVTDTNDANGGALCPMATDAFTSDPAVVDTCLAAPWTDGTPDPVEHHALETGRDAVVGHLPRAPFAADRVRPGAALGIVFLAAGPSQGLLDAYGPAPTAAEVLAYVSGHAALYGGTAPAGWLPPGTPTSDAIASVWALVDAGAGAGAGPDGLGAWAPGWLELADAKPGVEGAASAAALLDAVDDLSARESLLVLPRAAIPAGTSCNVDYFERAPARDGGFFVDPRTGGVVFAVGLISDPWQGCYWREWVDATP